MASTVEEQVLVQYHNHRFLVREITKKVENLIDEKDVLCDILGEVWREVTHLYRVPFEAVDKVILPRL